MFEWLKKYKLYNHIKKQSCFVFPIIPKESLVDGKYYESFRVRRKKVYGVFSDSWREELDISSAKWNKEKDCFIHLSSVVQYDDFKPIRISCTDNTPYIYGICSYNPCSINQLDLEELKKITFDLNDDNTESDTVWENLINYFEERGF